MRGRGTDNEDPGHPSNTFILHGSTALRVHSQRPKSGEELQMKVQMFMIPAITHILTFCADRCAEGDTDCCLRVVGKTTDFLPDVLGTHAVDSPIHPMRKSGDILICPPQRSVVSLQVPTLEDTSNHEL